MNALQLQIIKKIQQLESKTSVEFIPALAKRSSTYPEYRIGLILSLMLTIALAQSPLPIEWVLPQCLIAGGIATLMTQWPWLFKKFISPKSMRKAVIEKAHITFLKHELFATQKRTAVLIFISEFEKAVFILADKGLKEIIPDETWATLGAKLAKDLSKQSADETFLDALDEIGKKLTPHFPPLPGCPNELPNDLIKI